MTTPNVLDLSFTLKLQAKGTGSYLKQDDPIVTKVPGANEAQHRRKHEYTISSPLSSVPFDLPCLTLAETRARFTASFITLMAHYRYTTE